MIMFLVTGCSAGDKKIVCSLGESDYGLAIDSKMTIFASSNSSPVKKLIISQLIKEREGRLEAEKIEESYTKLMDLAKEEEGFAFSYEIEGDNLSIDIEYDFEKISEEKKEQLGLQLPSTLGEVVEDLELGGYTCK